MPDLIAERGMKTINRLFPLWLVVGLALPALLGFAIAGTWQGAVTGLLWGGAIRIFLLHHVTFSINSHLPLLGPPALPLDRREPQRVVLSLISFGESWHNNHHAFPSSAFHGMARFERRWIRAAG